MSSSDFNDPVIRYPLVDQIPISKLYPLYRSTDKKVKNAFLCYNEHYWIHRLQKHNIPLTHFNELTKYSYAFRYLYSLYAENRLSVEPELEKRWTLFKGIEHFIGLTNTWTRSIIYPYPELLDYLYRRYFPDNSQIRRDLRILRGEEDKWSLFSFAACDKNQSITQNIQILLSHLYPDIKDTVLDILKSPHFYHDIIEISKNYYHFELLKIVMFTNNIEAMTLFTHNVRYSPNFQSDILTIYTDYPDNYLLYSKEMLDIIDSVSLISLPNRQKYMFEASIVYADYSTFNQLKNQQSTIALPESSFPKAMRIMLEKIPVSK